MMISSSIRAPLWFTCTVVLAVAAFGAQQSTSSETDLLNLLISEERMRRP
jgi:hypothetical protein